MRILPSLKEEYTWIYDMIEAKCYRVNFFKDIIANGERTLLMFAIWSQERGSRRDTTKGQTLAFPQHRTGVEKSLT